MIGRLAGGQNRFVTFEIRVRGVFLAVQWRYASVFEMVLAVLLIISPFANIEHHVLLLGLELIAYPFRIESGDSGKLTVETEA